MGDCDRNRKRGGQLLRKYCNKYNMMETSSRYQPRQDNKQHLVTMENNDDDDDDDGEQRPIDNIVLSKEH